MNIELPCSGTTLPTKAEFVQVYNDILMIPSKLKAYSVANPDLDAEIQKQIDDAIKQIEDFAELQSSILSPYWQNGQIRNWQKEANDAWSELIDEFHMYIPTKILELISTVIPIEFTVTVMAIEVDLLKILEKEEQESVKKQITDEVDKYYALVPEGYQYYKGEFGIECDEWKGKLTWAYFKNELVKWCTNLLQAAFGALIDAFKEIWDTLGLPSLPALLEFDVETFIRAQIDAFKEQALGELASLEAQLEQLKVDVETLAEDAKKDAEEKIAKLEDDIVNFTINGFIVDQLKELILNGTLKPRDKLPSERDLVEQLGVSRPSVREALLILEAKGLVRGKQGGGTFVSDVLAPSIVNPLADLIKDNPDAIDDILECRHGLEALKHLHRYTSGGI